MSIEDRDYYRAELERRERRGTDADSLSHWPPILQTNTPRPNSFQQYRKPHMEITGLRIPFWHLVWFLVKLTLAAIPACIIIWCMVLLFWAFGYGLVVAWMDSYS